MIPQYLKYWVKEEDGVRAATGEDDPYADDNHSLPLIIYTRRIIVGRTRGLVIIIL